MLEKLANRCKVALGVLCMLSSDVALSNSSCFDTVLVSVGKRAGGEDVTAEDDENELSILRLVNLVLFYGLVALKFWLYSSSSTYPIWQSP